MDEGQTMLDSSYSSQFAVLRPSDAFKPLSGLSKTGSDKSPEEGRIQSVSKRNINTKFSSQLGERQRGQWEGGGRNTGRKGENVQLSGNL